VKGLTGVARNLRKYPTDTEQHLWRHLRNRQIEGFKFRRQQPVGRYVVDFVNLEKKVVAELDGGQHALDAGDRIRDEWLQAEGYKVLRFWDNQVSEMPFSPLTLTLSPKGRGEITFNNTTFLKRRTSHEKT